jgi:hypothetical protein
MTFRSGDLVSEEAKLWVTCLSFFLQPMGMALVQTTTVPEQLDAIEKTDDYKFYDKDEVQLFIVGIGVQCVGIAQALGGLLS